MNIIIVGCGKVGQALAEQLSREGNDITVIDQIKSKVDEIVSKCDARGVVGNGATHLTQREAEIKRADLLIAVTGSDELNLLCCLVARKEGSCRTIARVTNPDYSNSKDTEYLKRELGIAMVINPEQIAADKAASVLRFPSAIEIEKFAGGKAELLKFQIPKECRLVDISVQEAATKLRCDVLFCIVERGDEVYIANGNFVFAEKDIVHIVSTPRNANEFFKKINYKINSVKDVIIVGGGNISYYLCKHLIDSNSGMSIKLIEKDIKRAEELNTRFGDDVRVIHGDTVNKEVLKEEGIDNAGAFVSMTNLDEENIFLSLYVKSISKAKLVTKINRLDYDEVIKHLDLDSIIYPKNITTDRIVRYVRSLKKSIGSNVATVSSVIKNQVEAAEFIITEKSRITEKKICELQLKDDVLIAAILRNGKLTIPRGDDTIMAGDAVIVVSKILALHDINDILK